MYLFLGGLTMEDINEIKLPYTIKDKILMSPGVWNDFYYSEEEIQKAFKSTDWNAKENRSLFLDHLDGSGQEKFGALSWVGEITNPKIKNGVLTGDLVIIDKNLAQKLEYGAKMGISPKVTGETDEAESVMQNFLFDNFSVVINPAVKTAYINLSEMAKITDFETKRKSMGWSVSEFYAIPKDPPSSSKLPIFDVAHVRNALARFNQVKDITKEEKATAWKKILKAAKKFGIKVTKTQEEITMAEEEAVVEEPKEEVKEEVTEEVKEEPKEEATETEEEVEAEEVEAEEEVKEEEPKEEVEEEVTELKETETIEKAEETLSQNLIDQIRKLVNEILAEKEKDKEEVKEKPKEKDKEDEEEEKPKVEEKKKMNDNTEEVERLKKELSEVKKKLNEPDKVTTKGVTAELGTKEDVDVAFLKLLGGI